MGSIIFCRNSSLRAEIDDLARCHFCRPRVILRSRVRHRTGSVYDLVKDMPGISGWCRGWGAVCGKGMTRRSYIFF